MKLLSFFVFKKAEWVVKIPTILISMHIERSSEFKNVL